MSHRASKRILSLLLTSLPLQALAMETSYYGGADYGRSFLGVQQTGRMEPGKAGSQLDLRGMAAFTFDHWALDAGLGYRYLEMSGGMGAMGDQEITTRSAVAEVNPRYRFGDKWSLGPSLSVVFGPDQSQAPEDQGRRQALLAGAQLYYDISGARSGTPLIRVGARGQSDLNVPDRQLSSIQLGLQIGFGGQAAAPVVVAEAPKPAMVAPPASPKKVNIRIPSVHFETGRAVLRPRGKAILVKLGAYLKANPGSWERVSIGGHADRRGTHARNLELSRRRAEAVRGALDEGGAPLDRLEAQGHSYDQPLVSGTGPEAHAANRRVELDLNGVEDEAKLGEFVEELRLSR